MIECKERELLEQKYLKKEIPLFRIGDTIAVYTRILEGEKERLQMFSGVVIARKGKGLSETFSLYRVSYGSGMERVFMLHSPLIARIEVLKSGRVRKAKLYYLRGKFGKASKVKESLGAARVDQHSDTSHQEEQPSS
jgi:large subunit ribosomal protein L19